jgi:hypothetical protein
MRAAITDLHFHDLRRAGSGGWTPGSRWRLFSGLGHANISQTSAPRREPRADEQDMRGEARIGRVTAHAETSTLVTHSDVFGGSNGSEPPIRPDDDRKISKTDRANRQGSD